MARTHNMVAIVIGLAVLVLATPAHADAIDGEWCLASRHLAINGPNILTPGGNRIVGNYDRHGFSYVVPVNEEGAGTEVVMVLLNEENVRLTRGPGAAPEVWKRCKPTS
jgi:hypothetical protein